MSYYCLCLFFNKIGEEGRTGSAWKQGGGERKRRWGGRGRNCPNNVCTYEKMNNNLKRKLGIYILKKDFYASIFIFLTS
jgi:hypothetical protein